MNRRARGGGNSNCRWAGILIVADHSTVKTAKAEETTVKAKAAKTVHQVTPTVSIVKTDSELLHADLPAAKPTKTESRPPQPSPDHAWVVRGTGGYWRARKGSSK